MTNQARRPRDVVLVVYPDVQSLDFVGPQEVFAAAQADRRRRAHRARLSHHRRQHGWRATENVQRPGGCPRCEPCRCAQEGRHADRPRRRGAGRRERHEALLDWISDTVPHTRRVASVCTGAFVLAAAGLLDGRARPRTGRRATTLAERYPQGRGRRRAIYPADGAVWTSAGVTAGMDLALAHGRGGSRPRRGAADRALIS